ncbi:MAG: hypothetical protein M1820_008455 [Bogoriella megaspora]|nr:MAG: hypothetical protein M1820_008455 [Bogoriella megaspora]
MVQWGQLLRGDPRQRDRLRDEMRSLLPTRNDEYIASAIPAKEVTKTAIRIKYQIEEVIPCELEEDKITSPNSQILTPGVIKTTKAAGGEKYGACVVFCLLICKKWFKKQAILELWDADLHMLRATACEMLAKRIIEAEENEEYLHQEVLLKRYSIIVDGEETAPANAVEKAVDLHALIAIGSSGYQKCVQHLWRGWLVQDDEDPSKFVAYHGKDKTDYWLHFDPDRMRVPLYQNALQVFFSVVYLALFTGAINTVNPSADVDVVEVLLYIFTLGFICDEVSKFVKVGIYYLSFWNTFNCTLYTLLTASFITRMVALAHATDDERRYHFNEISYNLLACTAPFFWSRLLLYFDSFRFFGAMLVVLKVMMKESILFFTLLLVVIVGFLQAFIGLDQADSNITATNFVVQSMVKAILTSPEFDGFDNFAPPFGLILYYIFTFVVMVLLLNILIALYNSAYEDVSGNSDDEYMGLFAQKTLGFVRAPDENVFIAPLNLIEIVFLVIPFEWWLAKHQYERLNDYVMGTVYSPLLLITAWFETRQAKTVRRNRRRGEVDDDTVEEWEQMTGDVDLEGEGWAKTVEGTKPDVAHDATILEVRALREEVKELKNMIKAMTPERDGTIS